MKGISENFEQELPIAAVGGVVYRRRAGEPELLLIKKHRGFWTLPKGRIKPGETERPLHHVDLSATAASLLGVRTGEMAGNPAREIL